MLISSNTNNTRISTIVNNNDFVFMIVFDVLTALKRYCYSTW